MPKPYQPLIKHLQNTPHYQLHLTAINDTTLLDDYGASWEYVNAYFDASFAGRLTCSGCASVDFTGWRCLATGEARCNDCVKVSR